MITELYERLHMDVTEFDEEDVITTSEVDPPMDDTPWEGGGANSNSTPGPNTAMPI